MIIEVRAKNCYSFYDQIIFSMKADMRNKKFSTNVHRENNFNVLKTAGIYGANNVGKTCFIKCIHAIKDALSGDTIIISPNIFLGKSPVCELGITFLESGRKFSYDFSYDVNKEVYCYEKFAELSKDQYGNEKENIWLLNDSINSKYQYQDQDQDQDQELLNLMPLISRKNLTIYMVDVDNFHLLAEMKQIISKFVSRIDIVNMNNIPMQKTLNLMKNKNDLQSKVVNLIKNADLYMDDFRYLDADKMSVEAIEQNANKKPEENVLDIPEQLMDQMRLTSIYKGTPVPSMLFDSTGTKKIAALASYVIEALEQGKTLIVDELDSSLHFKLSRAIVALFNNELNTTAQMIFTIHDINLMDCKKMFRKEQIWFIHKDNDGVYMYSLAEFTAQQGVRDTTDIIEKYRKGLLGAIPEPELIKTLIDIKGNTREDAINE